MSAFDLTIFTIATNKYLDYFNLQKDQLAEYVGSQQRTQIVVATNQLEPSVLHYKNLQIEYVPIENYQWPEITLLRYHEILRHEDKIQGDYVMWLDTDMSIVRNIEVEKLISSDQVHYALQPGFVFEYAKFLELPLAGKMQALLPWFKAWLHFQPAAGTWETRRESSAYVPARERRRYVHGAVWVGSRNRVLEMSRVLARRIDWDTKNGLVAVWHDESHLNWYASQANNPGLLPKHFSAWPAGWQFDPIQAFALSLDKESLDARLKAAD